jgi:hypothetical protein
MEDRHQCLAAKAPVGVGVGVVVDMCLIRSTVR